MYIDRILAPIETLGPGRRIVIWTKGCSKQCYSCANPELWDTSNAHCYDVKEIVKIVNNINRELNIDGITISGGDPLEQKDELLQLTESLQCVTEDIIVYTGYIWDELLDIWCIEDVERLKKSVAVLIDGPYVDDLNEKNIVLRGSSNQRVIYFKDKYKGIYEEYLQQGRKIQNVYMGSQLISVGIHNKKGE